MRCAWYVGVGIVWACCSIAVAQVCDPNAPGLSIYDLRTGLYKTIEGGLYPGGVNLRPAAHESAGRTIAEQIVPLDTNGMPDAAGKIVLISIGYSNMTHEWASGAVGDPSSMDLTFTAKALDVQTNGGVGANVLIVDGAKPGQATDRWAHTPINLSQDPWKNALDRLAAAGSDRLQVQVACMKVAHASPTACMADDGSARGDAGDLAVDSAQSVRNLRTVFPNLKICYLLTRTYGGYALTNLNPEPFAFEAGYALKWLVEAQIQQTGEFGALDFSTNGSAASAPWMAWGPYVWANGTTTNGVGISWELDDFRTDDRTHPAAGAVDKVGSALLRFFLNDSTSRPWFRGACSQRFDFDADCDIDADDYAVFSACMEGGPVFDVIPDRCSPALFVSADADGDGDVDLADHAAFQRAFTGALP